MSGNTLPFGQRAVIEADGEWTLVAMGRHQEFARFRFQFPNSEKHTVVIVDTAKLLACHANDDPGFIIPAADSWPDEKRALHKRFLLEGQDMPFVRIEPRTLREPRWFGCFGERSREVHAVTFSNGRHRVRYLEYAGAQAFPVVVETANAALMMKICGWKPLAPTRGMQP